jgi:hypothetical protein
MLLTLSGGQGVARDASGMLAGREGHQARGTLKVRAEGDRLVVTFPANFRVTDTNKVLVGVGTPTRPDAKTLVTPLRSLSGAQTLILSPGTAAPAYTAVWLWCDQHQAQAGVARLR